MSAAHSRMCGLLAASILCLVGASAMRASTTREEPRSIATNRVWDVLDARGPKRDERDLLRAAGVLLGDREIHLAGAQIDGPRLLRLASPPDGEPLVRHVREDLRRPVDLDDFLLFLDDALRAAREGLSGETIWVTPGRGRKAGILIHPEEVFPPHRSRRYGEPPGRLDVDEPTAQTGLRPAPDGSPPGPDWTARYRNPEGEAALLEALSKADGGIDLRGRLESLMQQLRAAGAEVHLNSTVRSRKRGYLMWGAFLLGGARDEAAVRAGVRKLDQANRAWDLHVPIRWTHPAGWQRTRESAREMADTYQVVYATESGARDSDHYTGRAVDWVAMGLPRRLELRSPGGVLGRFDLSDASESRDLSLTPVVIEWVEAQFQLEKLRSDYPHWRDARPLSSPVQVRR